VKKEYDFSEGTRGAVIPQPGKTRITIYLDDRVIDAFRKRADAAGRGYQTMINEALRHHLGQVQESVDADTIRRIVREELRKTG
jgi:uncharacterized protein (DUF4415 family)